MLAITNTSDKQAIRVLDTQDGVVDFISESDLQVIRKSLKLYSKPEFDKCYQLYKYLTKAKLLGIKDTDIYMTIFKELQAMAVYTKSLTVPDMLYGFECNLMNDNGIFLFILKSLSQQKDCLFVITKFGCFSYKNPFCDNYSIEVLKITNDAVCLWVTDNSDFLTDADVITDFQLRIKSCLNNRPSIKAQKGVEREIEQFI